MNNITQAILTLSLILSPVWLSLIANLIKPINGDSLVLIILGPVIIAIAGLANSFIERKNKSASSRSILGYAISALLIGIISLANYWN